MVQFGGLISGLDTGSIISQLVNLERNKVRALESKRQETQSAISSFGTLRTNLNNLKDVLENMSNVDTFGKLSSSSTDETVLTAEVDGSASEGTYSVEVKSLAAATKTISDTFSDKDTGGLFGNGDLDITINGTTTTVTVGASDTLSDVKDAINASGADVTASIVKSDAGFHLIVNGKSTGTDNAVTFAESGTLALDLDDTANNEITAAADSEIEVDGLLTITSASNTVSDAIEGVTLNLEDIDVGNPVTLTIERDVDTQIEAFQDFVDAYNEVVRFVNTTTKPSEIGATGLLIGDSTMRGLRSSLQSTLRTSVATGSNYTSTSEVGLETNTDGTLKIEEDGLKEALNDDLEGVLSIFAKDTSGLATLFEDLIENYTDSGGLIDNRTDGLDSRTKDLNRRIDNQNLRIDAYQSRLEAQFLAMEQAISQLNSQYANFG